MKILVIGGAGYLGYNLCKRFILDNEVIVIDKMIYNNHNTFIKSKNISYIEDDIANIKKYSKKLKNVERVFYLSSPRLSDVTNQDIIDRELANLNNTLKFFDNSDCIFYFMSSCSVYGKNPNTVNEKSDTMVTSLYSKLKIDSENLIIEKNNKNHFIFRLATLYGICPFMRNDILINNFVNDIKIGKQIEVFDADSTRPHLHVRNAALILQSLLHYPIKEKITNIGYSKFNITKRGIVEKIEEVIEKKVDVVYIEANDSRDYKVSFDLFSSYYINDGDFHLDMHTKLDLIDYEVGIFELYVAKINLSLESFDSIIGCNRPNGSSKTWYIEEEGKPSIPKMWGKWNIVDIENNNKMWSTKELKHVSAPQFKKQYANYYEEKNIGNNNHIYFIQIFNPTFFEENKRIGFDCISQKYLDDVREGRCKIVMYSALEGYSGGKNNNDLSIINTWIQKANISPENVYYISGNLNIDIKQKEKGYNFTCIPFSVFDSWCDILQIPNEVTKYLPEKLFVSYNRNPRYHRLYLLSELLKRDLLDKGLVSLGRTGFDIEVNKNVHDKINDLYELTPLTINQDISINLATNVEADDYTKTFVSLVSESLSDDTILFLSEKIWKPIYMGHPFIVNGNPKTLEYLKSQGFKTFEQWWPESYDNITNTNGRIDAIVDIIQNLNSKNQNELIEMRKQMEPVLIHNQNHFKNVIKKKYYLGVDGGYYSFKSLLKVLADIKNNFI